MTAYIIEMSIGGTMRLKVEARDESAAIHTAVSYFIDDWEGAGPLKYDDIHVDAIHESDATDDIDGSVKSTGDYTWEYLADDPYERGENYWDDPSQEGVPDVPSVQP